jgi:hypothetical protein
MGKLNKNGIMTGMVVYTCNPHIETGRSWVSGLPGPHSKY